MPLLVLSALHTHPHAHCIRLPDISPPEGHGLPLILQQVLPIALSTQTQPLTLERPFPSAPVLWFTFLFRCPLRASHLPAFRPLCFSQPYLVTPQTFSCILPFLMTFSSLQTLYHLSINDSTIASSSSLFWSLPLGPTKCLRLFHSKCVQSTSTSTAPPFPFKRCRRTAGDPQMSSGWQSDQSGGHREKAGGRR